MLNIFIDTNIYLRFFSYSPDTINELEKLTALAEAGEITIFLTDQVKRELARNRDGELERALARFQKSANSPEIPRFAAQFEEAANLKAASEALATAKSALSEKLRQEIEAGPLIADKLVENLEKHSRMLATDGAAVDAARLRKDIGDPPGKADSLGDQINWELLMQAIDNGEDLHVISQDGDFFSKLNENAPSLPLIMEWKNKKGAALFAYRSLKKFASEHFPHIQLPSDVFKSQWISKLSKSGSFSTTHLYIEKLGSIFDDLTFEDAVVIFQAMIDNEQINWIAGDDDVKNFYEKLFEKFRDQTSGEMDTRLYETADYLGYPF